MEAARSAKTLIKVAGICGSLREGSFNRALLRAAVQICQAAAAGGEESSLKGMEVEIIDIAPLPMLNTDLEVNGTYPPAVEAFRQKIRDADAFLFASPEYNYSVTAPLKNAIDWASRPPNLFAGKTAAIVSAGGGFGGGRSQYHLRQIGVFVDLYFINKPEFFLKPFERPPKFDNDGNLTDEVAKGLLKSVLVSLRALTLRLHGER
ncbi:NAD(P)H:quinone oxidoreductase-like [Diospyros lotus]|uniref:NAD(P)H:quinone oxidoreductase-like n=1 Tax=Diospyros lotus TaxID=55363 RepID=UPI00225987EC|nr:NAD(P)H:quinone oxidoreductase-like [Diospyros lotus]